MSAQEPDHAHSKSSTTPQPLVNPVGASSNYSHASLKPVRASAQQAPDTSIAAPSTSEPHSSTHAFSASNVDRSKHGDAASAAEQAPSGAVSSQQHKTGLPGPENTLMPGYQLEGQGRAAGQKGGARNLNKPQDPVGHAIEPGVHVKSGPAVGSAERPIHMTGAPGLPRPGAVEPSLQKALPHQGKPDKSYVEAATAFSTSPTETGL